MCYAVVWQHVCTVRCVECALYGVCTVRCVECALNTAHSAHMLPHHRITYNDVVFTES